MEKKSWSDGRTVGCPERPAQEQESRRRGPVRGGTPAHGGALRRRRQESAAARACTRARSGWAGMGIGGRARACVCLGAGLGRQGGGAHHRLLAHRGLPGPPRRRRPIRRRPPARAPGLDPPTPTPPDRKLHPTRSRQLPLRPAQRPAGAAWGWLDARDAPESVRERARKRGREGAPCARTADVACVRAHLGVRACARSRARIPARLAARSPSAECVCARGGRAGAAGAAGRPQPAGAGGGGGPLRARPGAPRAPRRRPGARPPASVPPVLLSSSSALPSFRGRHARSHLHPLTHRLIPGFPGPLPEGPGSGGPNGSLAGEGRWR